MATLHEVMVERLKTKFSDTGLALMRKMAKLCDEKGGLRRTMPDIVAMVPGSTPVKYREMQKLVKEGYIISKPHNSAMSAGVIVYYTLQFPNSGIQTKEHVRTWVSQKNKILWDGLGEIEKLCKLDPELTGLTPIQIMLKIREIAATTRKRATWKKQSTNDYLEIA